MQHLDLVAYAKDVVTETTILHRHKIKKSSIESMTQSSIDLKTEQINFITWFYGQITDRSATKPAARTEP